MDGRHHVLLIGIDAYDGGGMLTGCVNDIDIIQRVLIDRVGIAPDRITRLAAPRTGTVHETDVPEALPTLDRIRAEFTRLGSEEVGAGDRVLIYYSGHGTQCIVAESSGRRFCARPCFPRTRSGGFQRRFLFDWELNALIARIAGRTPAVTVVLDCCSSAGATRGIFEEEGAQDRFLPTPEEYRLQPDEPGPADAVRGMAVAVGRVASCHLVAACRDDERARESLGEGDQANGELTRALVRQLEALPTADLADLRWGRIWRAVEADVRTANPRQSPWLSGSFGRRVFGYGGDEEGRPRIRGGADREPLPTGRRHARRRHRGGRGRGLRGGPAPVSAPRESRRPRRPERPAPGEPCRSIDVRGRRREPVSTARGCPRPPLQARPRSAPTRGPRARGSRPRHPARGLAAGRTRPSRRRRAHAGPAPDGSWALTDDVQGTGEVAGEPVLATIPAEKLPVARDLVEHYHAYLTPLRMARACRDLPSLLRLWILDCNGRRVTSDEAQDPDLPQVKAGTRAPYEVIDGDLLCFVVENGADVDLSVTLIDCAASGRRGIARREANPAAKQARLLAELRPGQAVPCVAFQGQEPRRRPDRGHRHHAARSPTDPSRAADLLRRHPHPAS